MEHSKELYEQMWLKMNLSREFEEEVQWLFSKGLVHGTTHLGVGEEATAVGSILALKAQDYVFGTHRGHNQAITKGVNINHMMAEILARATGVCKGKGGSMHIADPDIHYFGADGVLGTSAVMCCGAGISIKKKKEEDRIAAVFFGDGSSNEGAVFEAFNLASIWNLPVLFVCVNNTYGMSTPIAKVMKDTDISKRAIPFGMPSKSINGNNVVEVYDTIKEAREYVLNKGPMLVVENTYRISGHSKSDGNLYRTKEEINAWKEKCPIKYFRKFLIDNKIFTDEELDKIAENAKAQIQEAVEYAKNSPEPSVDDIYEDVYA
ncbi:thiamine pyrophosphate-dependent dehydrogenase E1 component subunit alpha [Frisingicoccus sp.]|uniref:thiamine pyrophosphate-dependent dehydrogenase E1 component subunit alpha n=1 Tax=Frisingicoccus sp. TaxID=1918627 RepID=UPI003AB156B1